MSSKEPLAWFRLESPDKLDAFKSMIEPSRFEGAGVDGRTGDFEAFANFSSKKTMESFDKKLRKLGLGELVDFVF